MRLRKNSGWEIHPDGDELLILLSGSIRLLLDGERVVGLAHLLTDGQIQAHLSLVGVHPAYRRRGIARRLLVPAFRASGAKWLDLSADPGSEEFYRSLRHQERIGFRVYPGEPTV